MGAYWFQLVRKLIMPCDSLLTFETSSDFGNLFFQVFRTMPSLMLMLHLWSLFLHHASDTHVHVTCVHLYIDIFLIEIMIYLSGAKNFMALSHTFFSFAYMDMNKDLFSSLSQCHHTCVLGIPSVVIPCISLYIYAVSYLVFRYRGRKWAACSSCNASSMHSS